MEIKKLILVDCIRLELRHIRRFEYTPQKPNQLIIGTNGSGKSSVMNELSPLPGDHNDFQLTGSKEIWIDHRGVSYKLLSTFNPKRHSFINLDTNEELNPGGTITVQNEKIYDIFQYDKGLHDLIIGVRPFHAMRGPERKTLMTMLSRANYDYALAMYKRINDKIRDVQGSLSINKKRLVTETSRIMPAEQIKILKEEVKELHDALQDLLSTREPARTPATTLEETRRQMDKEIYTMSALLINTLKRTRKDGNLLQLQIDLDNARGDIKGYTLLSTEYYNEHEEVSKIFASLEKTHTQNIASIETEIGHLEAQLEEINRRIVLPFRFETNADHVLAGLEALGEALHPILVSLPTNQEKQFSRASMEAATKQLEEAQHLKALIGGQIQRNQGLLDHYATLKTNDSVTCPNCSHTWIKNYDADKVQQLTETNLSHTEKYKELEILIKALENSMQEIREYFEKYRAYTNIVSQWPHLKPLWDYITTEQFLFNNPKHIEVLLVQLRTDCEVLVQNAKVQEEIEKKLALIKLSNDNAGYDYESSKTKKLTLEEKIFENQQRLIATRTKQESLQHDIDNLNSLSKMSDALCKLLKDHSELAVASIAAMRIQSHHDFTANLQSILARKETALREVSGQQLVIEDIEQQIMDRQFEERNLKLIAAELSPTEGLVAEGLFGFMKLFIGQMNSVIKKIWTYPFKVMPCALSEDGSVDLDYRFPLVVEGSSKPRKDIAHGSSAMKEVVDLAFRILAQKHMGLTDFPFFLDEFGKTMDPAHKAATVSLINTIMTDESFPQLFVISHDAVQYGSLMHTQICVMCDANMVIPKNTIYNEHVKIN